MLLGIVIILAIILITSFMYLNSYEGFAVNKCSGYKKISLQQIGDKWILNAIPDKDSARIPIHIEDISYAQVMMEWMEMKKSAPELFSGCTFDFETAYIQKVYKVLKESDSICPLDTANIIKKGDKYHLIAKLRNWDEVDTMTMIYPSRDEAVKDFVSTKHVSQCRFPFMNESKQVSNEYVGSESSKQVSNEYVGSESSKQYKMSDVSTNDSELPGKDEYGSFGTESAAVGNEGETILPTEMDETNVEEDVMTEDSDCPVQSANIVRNGDKWNLTIKMRYSPRPEPTKVFNTQKAAHNFWRFLKLNNKGFDKCHFNFHRGEEVVTSLGEQSKLIKSNLDNINADLESKGNLSLECHSRMRSLSEILSEQTTDLQQEEMTAQIYKDNINQKQDDIANDETMYYKYKLQELERKPPTCPNGQQGQISRGLCNARNVVKNHSMRLSRLENMICNIKSKVNQNQTMLSEIGAKLSNYTNGTNPEVAKTVKIIQKNIDKKCPPCPMYANTYPVDLLEVERQGVGSIIPKMPYTVSQEF